MRLHRIRLSNFRGVAARELRLPDHGVVIVEGPNESGKSSLAEALWLVFEVYDSSRSRRITDIQPVDRDVGVEIEVEVSTGPYRFTYLKRFLKRPETLLQLTAPRRETLKGRPAHERALQILDETIDRQLWKALRLVQGGPIDHVELHDSQGLAQALDRAAGQETAGERELSIFDRAGLEYQKYYTPTGRPRTPLTEAAAREADAAARVGELEQELQKIDDDVERCTALADEIVRLERDVVQALAGAERRAAELEQLRRREEVLKRLKLTSQSTQMEASIAQRNVAERDALRARHDAALRDRAELDRDAAKRAPALAHADQVEADAATALATAEQAARTTRALRELFDNDLEYHKQRLFFEQLRQRRDRVVAARELQAAARAELESSRIDDGVLKRIGQAELAFVRAEAQLSARSPQLEIRALAEGVTLDGRELEPGRHETRVDADATVALPGVAEITIKPGQSVAELRAARDVADSELRQLLDEFDVADVDAARAAHATRREAQRTQSDCEATIRENLGDLTLDAIGDKIERLRRWVERYPEERQNRPLDNAPSNAPSSAPDGAPESASSVSSETPEESRDWTLQGVPPLATDFDGTRDARTSAKHAAEQAADAENAARATLRTAAHEARVLRERRQEVDIRLRLAAQAERKAAADLGQARSDEPDDALAAQAAAASDRARAAQQTHRDEQRSLAEARPERIREFAENARRARRVAEDRLGHAQDEQRQLSISLELRGEKGLFDAREDARTERVRFGRESQAVQRRADAASMLFRTLRDERESARRAYSQPLRQVIERLARDVFRADDATDAGGMGAPDDRSGTSGTGDFAIELDDELRVRTRTLHGKTLAFDQLSVGAREQLGLVTRLACALLVDPDEGVPVILDDTLGHTDPDRLAGMAGALEATGKHSQVLLLTCSPERFRIPSAQRIVLR